MAELRSKSDLRALSLAEAGVPLKQAPRRSYFFVLGAHLETLATAPVRRTAEIPWCYFECHRDASGQTFVVAFCSASDARRISSEQASGRIEVVLAPMLWAHADTLVVVPLSRMIKRESRDIRLPEGMALQVLDTVLA